MADTTLSVHETSLVTVTFSESVTGLTAADMTVPNGNLSGFSTGDGGITWTATFIPAAAVSDTTNVMTLNNSGVKDSAGNAGAGLTNSANYIVETRRPTATIVVADTALAIGQTSDVTVTFSSAVSGFSNALLSVVNGTLSNMSSVDGGVTRVATLTPSPGVTDDANIITLNNSGVSNAAGNQGIGTTDSNNYVIDTVRPTAIVVVNPATLPSGGTAEVNITFSEVVSGFDNADLTAENGTLAPVSSSDGGITRTSTFTPDGGVSFDNKRIRLDLSGVADLLGNIGSGAAESNPYSINLPTIVPASLALPPAVVGMPYSQTFTGSGGLGGYGFTLISSTLPPEWTFAGGVLSGTPLSEGASTVTIVMTAAGGYTSPPYTYTLRVLPSTLAITPPVLPAPMRGVAYSQPLGATGGVAPYSYALATGDLPAGITLAPSGLLSGVPTGEGAYDFTIKVTDTNGQTATMVYTGVLGAVRLTPETLPDGKAGVPYAQTLTAAGGTAPYSFAVSAGALPAGLALSADGMLSGTPAQSGAFSFTTQASDALGARGTRDYALTIGINAELVRERFDELAQSFVETRMGLLSSSIELPGLSDRRNLSGRPGTVTATNSGNMQVLAFATSLAEINAAGGAAEALAAADGEQLPFNVWLDTRLTLHARTDETEHWGSLRWCRVGPITCSLTMCWSGPRFMAIG
ncbi:Ig-like domain-containing protein [Devosia sp. A8/3-2]|nr:Ig-like domain-containing protein [Devosia sp. A8/3-2]